MKQCFFTQKVNGEIVMAKIRDGNSINVVYFDTVKKEWIATEEEIVAISKFGKGKE